MVALLRSQHIIGWRRHLPVKLRMGRKAEQQEKTVRYAQPPLTCVVRPDFVFRLERLAVFVDGCFWHKCPSHFRAPRTNADYWQSKIQANFERDRQVDSALRLNGWRVMRIWEHELRQPGVVARRLKGRLGP